MTKNAVGLLFTILLLSLTCEAKAEPSGYVLTLPYVSDSSQCFVGTKAKDKVCIMIKDTIYNCNNIPVLVFDNPKDTSVRGIRNLESGVFFQLLNLSEKEDELLKKQMREYYKSTGHDDCVMSSFHYIVTFNNSGNIKDIYLLNLPGFLNHKVMARIIKKVFRGRNKEWWASKCKSQPSCYFGRFHIYILGETDDFRSSKDL